MDSEVARQHGHFTAMTTTAPELTVQDARVPLKKRSSRKTQAITPEDANGSTLSQDEKKREARRTSNRNSARRARIRIKTTIKELQDSNKQLTATNAALSNQLEDMLRLNSEMRCLMEQQLSKALEKNRSLQLALERRIAAGRSRPRRISKESPRSTLAFPSPLTHLPRSISNESPESKPASFPLVIESEGNMPSSKTIDVKIRHLQQQLKELKDLIPS